MKRGVKHIPLPNPPLGKPEAGYAVLGIPVEFSPFCSQIAEATGFTWNRKILVGPDYLRLPPRVQQAMLYHEARHCLGWHLEKRAAWFALAVLPLFFLPSDVMVPILLFVALFLWLESRCSRHEMEADDFSARNGYGVELLSLVQRHPANPPFYPSFQKRCLNLEQRIKEYRK